jgi:hypothetical protein
MKGIFCQRVALLLGRALQPWAGAALFIAFYLWLSPPQWQTDSNQLYRGCRGILDWMQGRSSTVAAARAFPLFQYISGVGAMWAVRQGFHVNIYSFWCTCSLLSLAVIAVIFHHVANRLNRPAVGWGMMAAMLSGMLLVYANSTFNEMVAAMLILGFTAAVTGDSRPVICGVLFWLSGITKETAPILLSIIWIGAPWATGRSLTRPQILRWGLTFALTLVITIATNAAFNTLRFGSIWNETYLQPHDIVHPWTWRAQYCVALWISPNGGVAAFWPTMVFLLIGPIVMALRSGESSRSAVLVILLLGVLTLGNSAWYTPFGWEGWGPRLMLPWLPASLLLLMRGYPESCVRLIDRCVRGKRAFAMTVAVVCVSALPQVLAAATPRAIGTFFENDRQFPHGITPSVPEQEYARNVYLAWEKWPPMLARPFLEPPSPSWIAGAICFIVALAVLLGKCRSSLGPPR